MQKICTGTKYARKCLNMRIIFCCKICCVKFPTSESHLWLVGLVLDHDMVGPPALVSTEIVNELPSC